jgi:hypothetical protein
MGFVGRSGRPIRGHPSVSLLKCIKAAIHKFFAAMFIMDDRLPSQKWMVSEF